MTERTTPLTSDPDALRALEQIGRPETRIKRVDLDPPLAARWEWDGLNNHIEWLWTNRTDHGFRIYWSNHGMTADEAELLAESLQQAVAWVREQEGRRG